MLAVDNEASCSRGGEDERGHGLAIIVSALVSNALVSDFIYFIFTLFLC